MANDDQAKGKAKDIGGKLKEEAGDATGNGKRCAGHTGLA